MSRRARIVAYGSLGLLIVAGGVLGGVLGGEAGGIVAIALVGVGFVGLVGMVFMEVGLSEDRDRACERRELERRELERRELEQREREQRHRSSGPAEDSQHSEQSTRIPRPGPGRRPPFRPRRPQ